MKKKKILKKTLYYILALIILKLSFNIVSLINVNSGFIKLILSDAGIVNDKIDEIIKSTFTYLLDVNKPTAILENSFHFKSNQKVNLINNKIEKDTQIYIYNTHQWESFKGRVNKKYKSKTVLTASFLLKEKLDKKNIKATVLEDSVVDYMNLNNMDYSNSYDVSRTLIKNDLKKKKFNLIIDLHRDSSNKKETIKINNKKCAKIIFVVGGENKKYKKNLQTVNKITKIIKDKYPSLTKGILIKKGKGVNGIYNQDLNKNMILLELGSDKNTMEEVENSINLLVKIIGEYLNAK